MSNVIPFQQAKGMPAMFAELFGETGVSDDLSAGVGTGYPHLSIKGKVFHVHEGDEVRLLNQPGTDFPAPAIEIVLLRAARNMSKVFYLKTFTDDSAERPDCFSNDGIRPDPQVTEPQSTACATCPHNAWGSRASEDFESKGKACQDARRVAIALIDDIEKPMLLRIPPVTLKELAAYGKNVAKRGVPYQALVTEIYFDPSVAFPKLLFRPKRFIAESETAALRAVLAEDDMLNQIIGALPTPAEAPVREAMDAIPGKPAQMFQKQAQQAAEAMEQFEQAATPAPAPAPSGMEMFASTEQAAAPAPAAKPAGKGKPKATPKPKAAEAANEPLPNGAGHAHVTVADGNVADNLDALLGGLPEVPNI